MTLKTLRTLIAGGGAMVNQVLPLCQTAAKHSLKSQMPPSARSPGKCSFRGGSVCSMGTTTDHAIPEARHVQHRRSPTMLCVQELTTG